MFLKREDHSSRELFTPKDFLQHYAESRGSKIEELRLHEVVIGGFGFSPAVIEELQRACEAQPTPRSHIYRGSYRGKPVNLIRFPPGGRSPRRRWRRPSPVEADLFSS